MGWLVSKTISIRRCSMGRGLNRLRYRLYNGGDKCRSTEVSYDGKLNDKEGCRIMMLNVSRAGVETLDWIGLES